MEDETLMLLSMKDSKSVADALSNKTAQKILSYIADNGEATESELSEKLEIPLPTVHYNIQQLKKSKLIKSKEFFWSKKGKKMRVFTLAKKYIIISPGKSSISQLKGLLPVALIAMVGAGIVHLYQTSKAPVIRAMDSLSGVNVAQETADKALPTLDASTSAGAINQASECIAPATSDPNLALWFFSGAFLVLISILIFNLIKKK